MVCLWFERARLLTGLITGLLLKLTPQATAVAGAADGSLVPAKPDRA